MVGFLIGVLFGAATMFYAYDPLSKMLAQWRKG